MIRGNWFSGQKVSVADLSFSSIETNNSIANRISDLFNAGVFNGLSVFPSTTSGYAAATSGLAYDDQGERIHIGSTQNLIGYGSSKLNDVIAAYQLIARYRETNDGLVGIDANGSCHFKHFLDSFNILALKTGTDSLGSHDVKLARVQTTLVGGSLIIDAGSLYRDTFSSRFGVNTSTGTTASFDTLTANTATIGTLNTSGDLTFITAGTGPIVTSADGTKTARLTVSNDGYLALVPLNYTL